tara:strand:- start:130 stop:1197 length:1068 start_codon:yes stop_codon:yes gene_type:complete
MLLSSINSRLQINNKYIGRITLDKLFNNDIITPNIQRILNQDKVNEIVNYQIENLQYDDFNFIGVINIHILNKINYLVDGQHRFYALKKLFSLGHNIPIFIEIVVVENYQQLKNNYDLINKNTPLPQLPIHIDKNIPETVAVNIKNKYPNIWSSNSRPNRPNIYFDYFLEALGVLVEKLDIKSVDELEKLVLDYNNNLINRDKENLPDFKTISDNMFDKCKQNRFYLGLYKHISDEYRYNWVNDIIYYKNGTKLKNITNKKKNIPKKLKIDIWNHYIGNNIRTCKCLCCNITDISIENFHAGHIISEKNNGLTTINNLLPICSGCNLSMNSKNMEQFINQYYPQNIDLFLKKILV